MMVKQSMGFRNNNRKKSVINHGFICHTVVVTSYVWLAKASRAPFLCDFFKTIKRYFLLLLLQYFHFLLYPDVWCIRALYRYLAKLSYTLAKYNNNVEKICTRQFIDCSQVYNNGFFPFVFFFLFFYFYYYKFFLRFSFLKIK